MLRQKRREAEKQRSPSGLDESSRELLEQNREERDKMDAEIHELRRRNVRSYVVYYTASFRSFTRL